MSDTKIPSLKRSDVFISYGRAESKVFATKLHNYLKNEGLEIWFDQNDIPLAVDFQTQIDEGILKTKNFIFIIAPHSLKSQYCRKEIELAIKYNKRIIPILHIEPQDKEIWDMMHPIISKLNWIYSREKFEAGKPLNNFEPIDNFDKTANSLLKLIQTHTDYINRHTELLIKAIEWDRNQRLDKYLISGQELADAENWLKIEFTEEQPPSIPTDIHCEFISESKEAVNNHQTDIFFCYSDSDFQIINDIYRKLTRKSYTSWIRYIDQQAGKEYNEAINESIEKASTILFFISSKSLNDNNCKLELDVAQKWNKRIIPIKIEDIPTENIPESIQKIFSLNFAIEDNALKIKEFDKLLNLILKDYQAHTLHKEILVKALNWEKQNKTIKYLLRGFDLESAIKWLQESNIRKEYFPTSLHKHYIEESRKSQLTVFISYARNPSKEFATKLYDDLTEKNYDVWFDQKNIPLAVDFQEQINNGIEKSDNFIFIISPNSIKSIYCAKEIELAIKYNKRIIPILHIEPKDNMQDMPQEIAKLNWTFFRENIDDYKTSFDGLVQVIERHSEYLKNHTILLKSALEWEKSKFDSKFLLTGKKRIEAEKWLKTEFGDDQAPSSPTLIHCEFISSSRKFAENFMSDSYICYAEEDYLSKQNIKAFLLSKGLTTADSSEVKPGIDYIKEIHQAIEKADNFLFLISPKSLKTEYCNEEISHALIFNKRIIPIMVEKFDQTELYEELQNQKIIDLSKDGQISKSYDLLLQTINNDKEYYQKHKQLFNNALHWKRQKSNPCMLLQGFGLENAKIWLEIANNRINHGPAPIQLQYINESLKQAATLNPEVYIAYAPENIDFAQRINFELQTNGKSTWFDKINIPNTENIHEIIKNGIEKSENCIFIICNEIIKSELFHFELEESIKNGKRIILLQSQDIEDKLPPQLQKSELINFTNYLFDFHTPFSELLRALDSDKEYIKNHNKWLIRAKEWRDSNSSSDLLLRGNELDSAITWYENAVNLKKNPKPTLIQEQFLEKSKNERKYEQNKAKQREKLKLLMLIILIILFISSAVFAFYANNLREHSADLLAKFKINNLILLANETAKTDPTVALRIAEEAMMTQPSENIDNLIHKIYYENNFYKTIIQSTNLKNDFDFANNGNIVCASGNQIEIFDKNGRLIKSVVAHQYLINKIIVAKNRKFFVTCADDRLIKIWDIDGNLLQTIQGHTNAVSSVDISPDNTKIISGSFDNTAKLWDLEGNELAVFKEHQSPVSTVAFSFEGDKIITGSFDKTAIIRNLAGQKIATLIGHQSIIWGIGISNDNEHILTISEDNTLRIWNYDGKAINVFNNEDVRIFDASFTPDGKHILMANEDKQLIVKDFNGNTVNIYKGHKNKVLNAKYAPDGSYLLSNSEDKSIKLWHPSDRIISWTDANDKVESTIFGENNHIITTTGKNIIFYGHNNAKQLIIKDCKNYVKKLVLSPNNQLLVAVQFDNTPLVFETATGKKITQLKGHEDLVQNAVITNNNQIIITASDDYTMKFWNLQGNVQKSIENNSSIIDIAISQNNEYLITANSDKTIKLWNIKGELLRIFTGFEQNITSISFSPDNQTFAVSSKDNKIRIWSINGSLKKVLVGHSDLIKEIKYSSTGKYLISASYDKTARLWDSTGYCVNIYESVNGPVETIDISKDEKNILLSAKSGVTRVYFTEMPYEEFRKKIEYDSLTTDQLLQFNLITFDNVVKSNNIEILSKAISFYTNQSTTEINASKKLEHQIRAVKLLEIILKIAPSNNFAIEQLPLAYNDLAFCYILNKKYKNSLKSALQAKNADKSGTIFYRNLALSYLLNDKFEQTEKIYRKLKDENYSKNIKYKDVFKGDIMQIQLNGINHPNFLKAIEILQEDKN